MSLLDLYVNERVAVKGMHDILPPDSEKWSQVEMLCREVFSSFGYGEIRTPIVEYVTLFARSVGENTDIVSKEMFVFQDRKGRRLALRPENTAGVVRALLEKRLTQRSMPLRLWYVGPQFRYERPQKGRYREFHQIGAELFGAPGPAGDAEVLTMLFSFLGRLGFDGLTVKLNCIGAGTARQRFADALRKHLLPHSDRLSEEDRRRLETNPLRLYDSKDPLIRGALQGAPKTLDYLDHDSAVNFETLQTLLKQSGIKFAVDANVVRGLDYYTTTVFEVSTSGLGAQDAILGGGRYDDLVQQLGGPSLAAVGFAIGEDRLLEVAPLKKQKTRPLVVIIPRSSFEFDYALRVATAIRKTLAEATVETDLSGRGFQKGLARVNSIFIEANLPEWMNSYDPERIDVVLLGPDERAEATVSIKNLESGTQKKVPFARLEAYFLDRGNE